jgi:E3 ubiquitin-protein ligase RNF4
LLFPSSSAPRSESSFSDLPGNDNDSFFSFGNSSGSELDFDIENRSFSSQQSESTPSSQSSISSPSSSSGSQNSIRSAINSALFSSSDTIEYEVPAEMSRQSPRAEASFQDDDDLIFIPPNEIETIDLCTQAAGSTPVTRARNRIVIRQVDEVIVIGDSPVPVQTARPQNSRRVSPYPRTSPRARAVALNISADNLNDTQSAIRIQCPICLENTYSREPTSTKCGHVFCKACLVAALQQDKKCPMCKIPIKNSKDWHKLFI